MIKIQF